LSFDSPYEPVQVEGEELPYIVTDEDAQHSRKSSRNPQLYISEAENEAAAIGGGVGVVGARPKLQDQPSTTTSSSGTKKRSPKSPHATMGSRPHPTSGDDKPPREKRAKEKRSKKTRSDHQQSGNAPPDNGGASAAATIDITKKSKENKQNPVRGSTASSRHPTSSRSDSQRKSIRRQAKVDSGDRPVRGGVSGVRGEHPAAGVDLSDAFDEEDSEVVDVKYEDQQRRKK
jgi:hypothetical protein